MNKLLLGTLAALMLTTSVQAQQGPQQPPVEQMPDIYVDVYIDGVPVRADQTVNAFKEIDGDITNTAAGSVVSLEDVRTTASVEFDVNVERSSVTAIQNVTNRGLVDGDVTNAAIGSAITVDFDGR